ncbi:MAG: selenide, water dikinase SelD, partial [Chloroflexi bacterium]|nr:selenide, water dikinase SelD [Chloroflexota bacterium]
GDPNVLVGFDSSSDAAVYKLGDDVALVLTVDFFPPIVDDPFDYGAIAAANAISDIYAMGARPITALNIAGFPRDLSLDILGQILAGGAAKAAEAGVAIVGGHSVNDNEPKYGLAVTGIVRPDAFVSNAGARPGDKLVLTKAIGTGVITTAGKEQTADPGVLAGAIESMKVLNRAASEAMLSVGVNAATDITGFGLVGHLRSMATASRVSARVYRSAVPVLPGTLELLEAGIAPGGTHRNVSSVGAHVRWHKSLGQQDRLLMCDAQTSGGLLIAVPGPKADALVSALKRMKTPRADIVGEITLGEPGTIDVVP